MSTTKHTPGPWVISDDTHGTWIHQGDSENCVASVYDDVVEPYMANARLIAAAPDLFNVAEWFVAECDRMNGDVDEEGIDLRILEKMARAAIAKALGE